MEPINYEERYPTHVSHASPPSYAHTQPVERQSNASPEAVPLGLEQNLPAAHNMSPYSAMDQYYAPSKPEPHPNEPDPNYSSPEDPPRKILGMTRTVFFLTLALVMLIIAGVIGGAVGGTLGKKNFPKNVSVAGCENNSQVRCSANPASSSAGTSTTLTTMSSSTSSVSAASPTTKSSSTSSESAASSTPTSSGTKIVQVASSTFYNGTTSNTYVYVYYQDGPNIMYTVYPGSYSFGTAQILSLSISPKAGTPLAATAYDNGDGKAALDLFYLDSSNNVVQASHTNTKSSTTVSLVQTTSIQSGTNVNPSSSLAAIYMDAAYGWRVYYQTTSSKIQELVGFSGSWNTGTTLGSGLSGTAITVSMISVPNLNVFYIDSSTTSLYFMAFTSSWSAPTQLTSASIPSYKSSSSISLAAIAQTEPDMLRVYYIGTDDEFHEFWCETTDSWDCLSDAPDQSNAWTASDSPGPGAVGAIGWQNQVRFYYFHDGDLVQADLDGAVWETGIISA